MKPTAALLCCLLTFMLAVDAAPKSPWRKTKRETDPCRDNIDSCDTCENPAMQCLACEGNRIISNDGYYCVECPANSDLAHCEDLGKDNTGKAKLCKDGFRLNSEENTCTACIVGCKHCQTDVEYCDENQCLPGFAYNGVSKTCTACPLRCAVCSYPDVGNANSTTTEMELTCDNCTTGAYKSGTSCLDCGSGCDTCLAEKGCTKCADGFYASSELDGVVKCSLCNSLYSGCTKCTKDECLECDSAAAQVLVDGSCQPCPANCKKCSNSESGLTCDECNSYFTLDASKQCVSCGQCDTCELDADMKSVCKTCPEQTGVIGQAVCDKCPENCLECSRTNIATVCLAGKCKPGYTRNGAGDKCLKCPVNCDGGCHYSNAIDGAACDDNACAAGFAVNSESGECVACPDDCLACYVEDGNVYCTEGKCKPGTARNDITKLCVTCPDDCLACYVEDGNVYCTEGKCKPGTARNDNTKLCVKCPDKCDSCYVKSEQETVCVKCSSGTALHPVTKECLDCNSNCKACSVDDKGAVTCMKHQCSPGYYWKKEDGKCYDCQVSDCIYCKEPSKCLECSTGFLLSTDLSSCKATDACSDGAVFDDDSKTVKCATCASGWYSTNADALKMCSKCDDGCKACNVTNCLTCESEIPMIKTGTCLRLASCELTALASTGGRMNCQQCDTGYTAVHGYCHKCPNGCSDCKFLGSTGRTECVTCEAGYWLTEDHTCAACSDHCSQCTAGDSCDTCVSGYFVSSGSCVACGSNCLTCANADVCNKCQLGYMIVDGECKKCPENCESCTSETTCAICSYGYVVTGSSDPACIACSDGGEFCEYISPSAKTLFGMCKPGYGMNSDDARTCLACPTGFTACYVSANKAVGYPGLCQTGYVYVDNDKSCKPCANNCNQCSTPGGCDTDGCLPGSGMKKPGICSSCGDNCNSCETNGAGKCDDGQCVTGYVYDSTDQTCKACGGNCNSCGTNGAGKCDDGQCVTGYVYDSSDQTCKECGGNCNSCGTNGAGKCDDGQCVTGYYLDSSDKTCKECPSDCNSCNADGCDPAGCAAGYAYDTKNKNCKPIRCKDPTVQSNNYYSGQVHPADGCDTSGLSQLDGCQFYVFDAENSKNRYCPEHFCQPGYVWKSASKTSGSGYKLGTCEACPSGCLNCITVIDSTECLQSGCASGYAIKPDGTCTACPQDCDQCVWDQTAGTAVCIDGQCTAGFAQPTADICIDCPTTAVSCALENGELKSILCDTGYVKTSEGLCFSCPANCEMCTIDEDTATTTCQTCTSGYVKDETGQCVQCPAGCDSCTYDVDKSASVCKLGSCQEGYRQDQTTLECSACSVSNCISCLENGSCIPGECKQGFYSVYKNGGWECVACISNCLHCEDGISCLPEGCMEGSVRNSAGECVECGAGCNECRINQDETVSCVVCNSTHAPKISNSAITECVACPDGCKSCSYQEDIDTTSCDTCLDPYYEETKTVGGGEQTVCTACGDNVQKCSSVSGTKFIDTCASGTGKYPDDGASATDCKACPTNCASCKVSSTCTLCNKQDEKYYLTGGVCYDCPANCVTCKSSESSPGCYTCEEGYRRYKNDDGHYICQKCTDPNCLECKDDVSKCTKCHNTHYLDTDKCVACSTDLSCIDCGTDGVCKTCRSGTYLTEEKTCLACAANCAECDATGCLTCNDEWLVNKGQCGNCPFHCKKCTMDSSSQSLKCDSQQCYDGYGLDASKYHCIDCVTLTGVEKCATCTDADPATNKSTCLSCQGPRYAIDENNAACLDCNDIENCGACIDRPRVCTSCKNDLETSRNKTICGAMCYLCLGDGCPENPTVEAVDYITLDLVFCPEYCIVRTKWEYSGSGSDRVKVKILHREYGCKKDNAVNVAGADGCRQDNRNCAIDSEDYEVCCYKGYKNFNSGASALVMVSLTTLLMFMAAVQLMMN